MSVILVIKSILNSLILVLYFSAYGCCYVLCIVCMNHPIIEIIISIPISEIILVCNYTLYRIKFYPDIASVFEIGFYSGRITGWRNSGVARAGGGEL